MFRQPVVQAQILVVQGLLSWEFFSEKVPYYISGLKGPGVGKRWPKYRYCLSQCLKVRGGTLLERGV